MIELLTAMGILGIGVDVLTTVLVSATNADVRMNQNFQAQTQARTALERFRREGTRRAAPIRRADDQRSR
jgi:type II secretory pathway pseudopilin PulG